MDRLVSIERIDIDSAYEKIKICMSKKSKNILSSLSKKRRDRKKIKENHDAQKCYVTNYDDVYVFDDWVTFIDLIDELDTKNRIYNEFMPDFKHVKPYLDIEWLTTDNDVPTDIDKFISDLKSSIISAFNDMGPHINHDNIYISECHRHNKMSFHVVVSSLEKVICFESTSYCKYFAKIVRDKMTNINESYSKLIDLNPYSNGQNFRLIGNCKKNDYTPLVISEYSSKVNTNDMYPYLDHIITYIPSDKKLLRVDEQEDFDMFKKNIDKCDIFDCDQPEIDYITELLKEKCHETVVFDRKDEQGFLHFNYKDRKEKCFVSDNYHDKLGMFVLVNKKYEYIAGCFSSNCCNESGAKKLKIIGSRKERITFKEIDFNISWQDFFDCIESGMRGCARLFEFVTHDRPCIKYCNIEGTYYIWKDNLWKKDATKSMSERKILDVLKMVIEYFEKKIINSGRGDENLTIDDEYVTEIRNLCDISKKKLDTLKESTSILKYCTETLQDDEFSKMKDNIPNMLALKDYILRFIPGTGEIEKLEYESKYYVTHKIDINYEDDVSSKDFDDFILSITSDKNGHRKDLYNYFKWFIGYCIQGDPKFKKFFVLYGPHGNNGKSILCSVIDDVLCKYTAVMNQDIVFYQGSKAPGSASPELMQLNGKKIGIITDTDQDARLNDGLMKKIAGGGEKISARDLFKGQTEFIISFVPVIASNHRFRMNADDEAMMNRLVCIPFELSFVNNPEKDYQRQGDNNIKKSLLSNREGILKWLVEAGMYYHSIKEKDVIIPECIKNENKEYYVDMDPIRRFIRDYLVFSEGNECDIDSIFEKFNSEIDFSGKLGKTHFKNKIRKYKPEWVRDNKLYCIMK